MIFTIILAGGVGAHVGLIIERIDVVPVVWWQGWRRGDPKCNVGRRLHGGKSINSEAQTVRRSPENLYHSHFFKHGFGRAGTLTTLGGKNFSTDRLTTSQRRRRIMRSTLSYIFSRIDFFQFGHPWAPANRCGSGSVSASRPPPFLRCSSGHRQTHVRNIKISRLTALPQHPTTAITLPQRHHHSTR